LRYEGTLEVSHETINRHIEVEKASGGDLHTHLHGAHKQRRKPYGAYDSRGRPAGKRHNSERPQGAESRSRVGHWETDTVMGSENQHQYPVQRHCRTPEHQAEKATLLPNPERGPVWILIKVAVHS
jgi:IS30 family transposase